MAKLTGRPVPNHGSGGGIIHRTPLGYRRDDPDETDGRRIYRARAEAEALRGGRKATLLSEAGRAALSLTEQESGRE